MPNNSKKQRSDASITQNSATWKLGPNQIGAANYGFLVVCILAQAITILLTWPTWQFREAPVNLPWIASTPQFSCGILLIVTLVLALVSPRKWGVTIHLIVLGIAILMDQFRCQPQILSVTVMMVACVWPSVRSICVWFLVTMWIWAGVHKLISPDWTGFIANWLFSKLSINDRSLQIVLATTIALSELGLGLVAWIRPKLAVIGCVGLHIGIVIFLLAINWNASVLPWNLATAIVGAWLLWTANTRSPDSSESNATGVSSGQRLKLPAPTWGKLFVVVLFVVPAGTYFGAVRHCFAHVLYSGNLPIAVTTHHDGLELLDTWKTLHVPFPHEPKAYRDYFALTASVGEKLHIHDPRSGVESQYYVCEPDRSIRAISESEFFQSRNGSSTGVARDDPAAVFKLAVNKATMKKRSKKEMVFAVLFNPDHFKPELLSVLHGLPNLEEIQLADCNLTDRDLRQLNGLNHLTGIGLSRTSISDAGLANLQHVPKLQTIEHEGSLITSQFLEQFLSSRD